MKEVTLNQERVFDYTLTDEDLKSDNTMELLVKIHQLQSNWKELKEFIDEEIKHNVDGVKSFSGYQCKIILDKMQEIESGKNE